MEILKAFLLEALRQLRNEIGKEKSLFIHITLVPFISSANEFKTKAYQHSVKELLGLVSKSDLLICRTENKFSKDSKKNISIL